MASVGTLAAMTAAAATYRRGMRREGGGFDPGRYDMLGIAHPILGFDCPGFIYDFARSLPQAQDKPTFLLKTAGDFHSINNSASHSMKKILRSKGYDPFYDEIVAMPRIPEPLPRSRTLEPPAITTTSTTRSATRATFRA